MASKRFSEFVPGYSCDHRWMYSVGSDTCRLCHATCERDGSGKIVKYDATHVKAVPDAR